MRHREIRFKTLVLAALLSLGLAFVVFTLVTRSGSLVPRPPVLAGILLVVMGGLVLWMARPVRRYLQGQATGPLDPLRAARVVVLAQAAALTGSLATGWYLGQAVVVATDLSLVANQMRLLPLLALAATGLALAAAGLVAQRWCRVDGPDDEDPDRGPSARREDRTH